MSATLIRRSGLALAVTLLALAAILSGRGTAPADGADPGPVSESRSLAAAPNADPAGGPSYGADGPARAQAARAARSVPLPAGGSFAGIRWEQGGELSAAEIDGVLQYNAFCQWLLEARAGKDPATALAVLEDVPGWSGFREQPDLPLIERIVEQAHAGGGEDVSAAWADCSASQTRQASYAAAVGR